jgi:hypothetical protein
MHEITVAVGGRSGGADGWRTDADAFGKCVSNMAQETGDEVSTPQS